MRTPDRRTLLAMAVGLLCYVAGMVVLFVAAIVAFLSIRDGGNPAPVLPYLLVGLALVIVGRVVGVVYGSGDGALAGWLGTPGHGEPHRSDQNALEQLGYVQPEPEPSTAAAEQAPDTVVCRECGTTNDTAFSYCENCAAKLPG